MFIHASLQPGFALVSVDMDEEDTWCTAPTYLAILSKVGQESVDGHRKWA